MFLTKKQFYFSTQEKIFGSVGVTILYYSVYLAESNISVSVPGRLPALSVSAFQLIHDLPK